VSDEVSGADAERRNRHPRALVATWASGGNLPPLLAVADVLSARGLLVDVLTSAATRMAATRRGLRALPYRSAPEPDETLPFELNAQLLSAQAAGLEVARDVLGQIRELSADLLVADCMLPAALAAGEAAEVPTVSVVHFPYALARSVMVRGGGAWTTDRATLDATRRELGLRPTGSNLDAWESPQLLLATLPRWFDALGDLPGHIVHAGPLGVSRQRAKGTAPSARRALLSFSTTIMEGQERLVASACSALELAGVTGLLTLGPAVSRRAIYGAAGVEVVDWANHDDVMPLCDVVVTHGGLGTILRALAHGRPLLVIPLGRDQQFNASRVAELGAGLTVPADAPATEIAKAVERLFEESAYTDIASKLATAIASDRPDVRAGDALSRTCAGGVDGRAPR
jgi:hypothetical protein